MNLRQRALKIVAALEREYPDAQCSLSTDNALELLVAARLSAQCTDSRVNLVTVQLFEKYRTLEDYAGADREELEAIIRSCGLYKTKARDIIAMCRMLLDEFGSRIPDTVEELVRLPGVGPKIANLIVGDVYGKPAIVVDTHCIRLSNRLGLADSKDPRKVEQQLKKLIPPEKSSLFCHRLVWHGRAVCTARKPNCAACALREYCKNPQI